ncbi:MAG: hypothetical protein ACLQUY_27800 [Ktedonobacterales bacterium]
MLPGRDAESADIQCVGEDGDLWAGASAAVRPFIHYISTIQKALHASANPLLGVALLAVLGDHALFSST